MLQPGRCQATGTWLISAETKNEELLIGRQRFRKHGYIDGNNWSRRLWKESYRQLQESSWRESTIYPGNAGGSASILYFKTRLILSSNKWLDPSYHFYSLCFVFKVGVGVSRLPSVYFCRACLSPHEFINLRILGEEYKLLSPFHIFSPRIMFPLPGPYIPLNT
jgi:hypothetical protein